MTLEGGLLILTEPVQVHRSSLPTGSRVLSPSTSQSKVVSRRTIHGVSLFSWHMHCRLYSARCAAASAIQDELHCWREALQASTGLSCPRKQKALATAELLVAQHLHKQKTSQPTKSVGTPSCRSDMFFGWLL